MDKSSARSKVFAASHQNFQERDERLEALKTLVDHLAHDFNNMLVPLLGYVALIKEELSPDSSPIKYAMKIESSARKTESVIERILTAVRPQRCFNPSEGDLAHVIEQVLGAWQSNLPQTSQIKVQSSLVPCPLTFDHALLAVLIEQLLNNARYAMAMGGVLKIEVRPRTLAPQQSLELNVPSSVYELVVSDNGFGMSSDTLSRACEPLFTTRPRGQALGLGLTAVHSIAHLHGGQILIHSAEDVGTTVTIWLPTEASAYARKDILESVAPERSENKRGSKVLVVDDDPMVREVLKTYLHRLPIEVTVAQDGVEGLRIFQRNRHQFGLIVSDICMPKMNGIEFFENIRKLDPEVPVVWMSGDPEAARESALAKLGPTRPMLLKKPFSLKELTETIRAQLR